MVQNDCIMSLRSRHPCSGIVQHMHVINQCWSASGTHRHLQSCTGNVHWPPWISLHANLMGTSYILLLKCNCLKQATWHGQSALSITAIIPHSSANMNFSWSTVSIRAIPFEKLVKGVSGVGFSDNLQRFFCFSWGTPQWHQKKSQTTPQYISAGQVRPPTTLQFHFSRGTLQWLFLNCGGTPIKRGKVEMKQLDVDVSLPTNIMVFRPCLTHLTFGLDPHDLWPWPLTLNITRKTVKWDRKSHFLPDDFDLALQGRPLALTNVTFDLDPSDPWPQRIPVSCSNGTWNNVFLTFDLWPWTSRSTLRSSTSMCWRISCQ